MCVGVVGWFCCLGCLVGFGVVLGFFWFCGGFFSPQHPCVYAYLGAKIMHLNFCIVLVSH